MAKHTILLILLSIFAMVHSLSLESARRNIEKRDTRNKYRLPDDVVPIHYDVKLNLDMETDDFTGDVRIKIDVKKPTGNIVLNSNLLTINKTFTNLTKDDSVFKPSTHVYDTDTEMLHLRFTDILEPGVYTLNMKFEGRLSDDYDGLFKSSYVNEQNEKISLIATHFQLTFARSAFPCWDEPAFKATFNISLKHPDNYTALSNMPAYLLEHDENDGKIWTHFETTPVMSTNILGLVVFDFPHVSNSDGTTRIWVRKEKIVCAARFMTVVERAARELMQYLNNTLRVPKMDHVGLPYYSSRALENWGVIIYLDHILCDPGSGYTPTKMLDVTTVIHELAHQWFGNLVSPSWWKYYWLNEGMSQYLRYYITDKIYPDWKLMDAYQTWIQVGAFVIDEDSSIPPVNKDFNSVEEMRARNSFVIYRKSSFIISMLSHIIGEDVFRAGLINYINTHKYSNVTSDDLWEAMQNAMNDSSESNEKPNIKEVMDPWVEQTGYPFVIVTRNYTTGKITIHQELSPFSKDRTVKTWWIPINYATKSVPDFSSTKPTHWLSTKNYSIVIEGVNVNDWIIVNLQQSGYYCVNYDMENWKKIADYLNSDDHTKIHAGNKVQLIHTAFRLTISNYMKRNIFIQLSNYLRRETDPVVWNSLFKILSEIKPYINHPEGSIKFKPHILGLMTNFMESVGYDDSPADTDVIKIVRGDAIKWACVFDHPDCIRKAMARINTYLENPQLDRIPSGIEEWVLCNGLAKANQSAWDKVFDMIIRSHVTSLIIDFLPELSCAQDKRIIDRYLNLSITDNSTITNLVNPADIFLHMNDQASSNLDAKINFFIEHFDKLSSDTHEANIILNNLIWKINRMDNLDKLKLFLQSKGINKVSDIHYREKYIEKFEKVISDWSISLSEQTTRQTPSISN